jgi:hypothetical protein
VRNMTVGAKVALSIMDPDNSDRYVQLRGTVTRVTEDGCRWIRNSQQWWMGRS